MSYVNAHIGRLEHIGIKKTGWSDTYWLSRMEGDLKPVIEQFTDEGVLGVIESKSESITTSEMAELNLGGKATDKSIWLFLLGALGQVTSWLKDWETIVYEHEFSVLQSNNHPGFEVTKYTPISSMKATLMKIEELTISASKGEEVKLGISMKGQKMVSTSTPSPSYGDELLFLAKHISLYMADTEIGLASAESIAIDSIKLSINKNLEPYGMGDTPEVIFNKNLVTSGSIDSIFKSDDFRNLVTNSTKKFFRIVFTNPTVIGEESNPTLEITFAKIWFDDIEYDNSNDDIVRQTLPFTGLRNNTAGYSIKIKLTNTVDSY